MADTLSIREARTDLGGVVRRARNGERTTITDHGHPAAVVVPVDTVKQIDDLETALAVTKLERDRALGVEPPPVPHEEAKATLRSMTEEAR